MRGSRSIWSRRDRVELGRRHARSLGALLFLLAPSANHVDDTLMNDASKRIDGAIEKAGGWRGEMLKTLRKLIHEVDPEIVEEWKWMGTPTWNLDGIICVANAHKEWVRMTFPKGAKIKDTKKVFNAELEGNVRRAITWREGEKIDVAGVKELVRAAIALNEEKPAGRKTGAKGSVTGSLPGTRSAPETKPAAKKSAAKKPAATKPAAKKSSEEEVVRGSPVQMLSVYSDGSSAGRSDRAGGWAFVVVREGALICEGSGGARATNSNAMELEAARAGLRAAIAQRIATEEIELVTDSRVTLEALREECASDQIKLRWIRAHSDEAWNETVDAMAGAAKQAFIPARVRRKMAAGARKKKSLAGSSIP